MASTEYTTTAPPQQLLHSDRRRQLTIQIAFIGLALAFAILLPVVASGYLLFQWSMVIIYALAIVGLIIVTGFNGQISLGHGAFFAVGAYATAIGMSIFHIPYWATLPISGVVCYALGFLLGLPALRLEGVYLALTTFALAISTPQILKYRKIDHWTGGVNGMSVEKIRPPFGLPLSQDQWIYFFSLAVAVALFIAAWNLLRGRIGLGLRVIRDYPLAAEAMGINVALLKTKAFALSALFTGVAGSLSTIAVQFVAPDSFSIALSISLFVGMVVGGSGSLSGAVWGALFIEFVPNVAGGISKAAPGVIYGVVLIFFMYAASTGVGGLVTQVIGRLATRKRTA